MAGCWASPFGICFVTGLISRVHQNPPAWLDVPSRPVWAYQLTQGLHVATGIASVPLLLAKLWTVYRRLFAWPPFPDLARLLERLLLVPLVAGAVFELVTGLLNIVQWYPWRFAFPVAHYRVAWLLIGALLVHLAVKAPLARSVTGRRRRHPDAPAEAAPSPERRAVLPGVAAAAGAVTVATVGQTVAPLRAVSLLAPRDPALGPQGLPVNRTAAAARVAPKALDPGWRLLVAGRLRLSMADLLALPQHEAELPIACVEGWSASARWGGFRLRDVLECRAVLGPLALVVGAVVVRHLARPERRVVTAGLLVAACLVLVALPALLTPGVPDNPTTTPRNYGAGLAVLLAADAAVTAALVLTARRRRRPDRLEGLPARAQE